MLLLFLYSAQAAVVSRLQYNQLEYLCADTSLGILLPFNRQVTFNPNDSAARVSEVLGRELNDDCRLNILGANYETPFCDLIQPLTKLRCADQDYHFVQYEHPIPPEQHAKFLEYQKTRRVLQKPNVEKEYPYTSTDIIANNIEGSIGGYFLQFWENHFGPLHPFLTYSGSNTGIYSMQTGEEKVKGKPLLHAPADEPIRMAMTADFGAGTREADYVSQLMVKDFQPHFTLHGGDVYYVGLPGEIVSNTLGVAPPNTKYGVKFPMGSIGGFAMNGNHEMYSRGFGYFDSLLPAMGIVNRTTGKPSGQGASYAALESAYWRVINLDTGYNTYVKIGIESKNNTQPKPVVDWLRDEVKLGDPTDRRGIILLSHHQYFSAFGNSNPSTATPSQIASLLPNNRTIIWLWGHEHRLAFYERNYNQSGLNINVYGRCVGNGGYPTAIAQQPPRARETKLKAYDDRLYQVDVGFRNVSVGYNGWLFMTFQNNSLAIEYRSLMFNSSGQLTNTQSNLLVAEKFSVDSNGNVVQTNFTIVDKNMTVVTHA